MAEPRTRPTQASVKDFIDAVEPPQKREDCWTIARLMERVTGAPPVMWGPSIVGFGRYTSTGSAPADWPITGFSPRKGNIVLYVLADFPSCGPLLERLGKHGTGKACLYIKRISDIDLAVLEEMVADSVAHMAAAYPTP